MSKPRKKSIIIPIRQIWQFQKPKDSCQFIYVEHNIVDGWSIGGRRDKDEFIFKGYINPEDLVNAEAVSNLLIDAIAFIKSEMKKRGK
jgi:hypothetical protein